LKELTIPIDSIWAGQTVIDLNLPSGLLILMIARDQEFVQPKGSTRLEAGDTLLILAEPETFHHAKKKAEEKVSESNL
jgi:cell volume regulation protein A